MGITCCVGPNCDVVQGTCKYSGELCVGGSFLRGLCPGEYQVEVERALLAQGNDAFRCCRTGGGINRRGQLGDVEERSQALELEGREEDHELE